MDNQNNLSTEKMSNNLFKKLANKIYSFLFELPFKNYKELYQSGKIQKMTKEEKIKFIVEMHKENQHLLFFKRLLIIRPTFLDDDDLIQYRLSEKKIRNYRYIVVIGLFFNWNYFTYNFWVKKRYVFKSFIFLNFALFGVYSYISLLSDKFQEDLFRKYKNILKQEDVFKIIKESYRID